MYGGTGNDKLGGGTGNNWLYGEADADVLSGREGLDRLTGGGGNDTFQYWKTGTSKPGAANRDVILTHGVGGAVGDQIDLSTINARHGRSGRPGLRLQGNRGNHWRGPGSRGAAPSGSDTLIQANTGGTNAPELEILVKDGAATPGQWVAGDFIL